jgi:hypothetical protein
MHRILVEMTKDFHTFYTCQFSCFMWFCPLTLRVTLICSSFTDRSLLRNFTSWYILPNDMLGKFLLIHNSMQQMIDIIFDSSLLNKGKYAISKIA